MTIDNPAFPSLFAPLLELRGCLDHRSDGERSVATTGQKPLSQKPQNQTHNSLSLNRLNILVVLFTMDFGIDFCF